MTSGTVVFSVTYIGDLVQATLTFDTLAQCGPLTIVTSSAAAPLLAADPRIARVETIRSSHPLGWRVAVWRKLRDARGRRDRIVNLEVYGPRWAFVKSMCAWMGLNACHLDLPGLKSGSKHMSAHYAAAAGIDPEQAPPTRLFVEEQTLASTRARLHANAREGGHALLVVHVGSSRTFTAKRVPPLLISGVLARLSDEHVPTTICIGTEADRPATQKLIDRLDRTEHVHDWVGTLSLVELAALLRQCDLFLGSDSGPLKIAEAVGARTLSFWGPTSPDFVGPRGDQHRMLSFDVDVERAATEALDLLSGVPRVQRR